MQDQGADTATANANANADADADADNINCMNNNNTCICPADIISGALITKDKRHELFGQIDGGAGSCKPERYQRSNVEQGTGLSCSKTNMRINLRTSTLEDISHPNKANNGFDYTEDFDGIQTLSMAAAAAAAAASTSSSSSSQLAHKKLKKTRGPTRPVVAPVYINFKSIVGKGGGQTRSLREVYWFIDGQMKVVARCKDEVYFANILDGDEAHAAMPKFEYLASLPEYTNIPAIKNNIYVGDLKGYFEWFKTTRLARVEAIKWV